MNIYILVKRLTENEDVFICYCYETALYIEFHKSVCTVHLTDLGLNILRIFNEVATTNEYKIIHIVYFSR